MFSLCCDVISDSHRTDLNSKPKFKYTTWTSVPQGSSIPPGMEIEMDISKLINEYRISIEVSPCILNNTISLVARGHTLEMIELNTIGHFGFPDRYQTLVVELDIRSMGENVAYGYSTAESFVNAWIHSPNHLNILSSPIFTHFGISVVQDESGRYYATQIFTK